MSVRIDWDDDRQQILRVTVEGRWAWDDLDAALRDAIALMDSVDHKVHFIIDIRSSQFNAGSALGQVQKAATPESHRNEGVKVVVGANRMVRMLYGAYRKVTQAMGKDQEFLFADSLDSARRLIRDRSL